MKCIATSMIVFVYSVFLTAQPQYRFRNFDTRDGLSHYQVNCLQEDSRGFLWIGTEFGLNRFDGVTFEKWYNVPGDSTSLINNNISTIAEDLQHHLWVSTEKGISIYDNKTGKFRSFREIETQNSGTIDLQQPIVFCDKDGDVWIGNGRGSVILYKPQSNIFFNIPVLLAPQGRMQNKFIGGFLQDSKNRIWVSTSYGIYLIDKYELKASPYRIDETHEGSPAWNACTTLFETKKGHLLCGTWNAGFLIFDEKKNTFGPYYGDKNLFLPEGSVFHFGQYDETILFSTGTGLFSFNEKDLPSAEFKEYWLHERYPDDPLGLASTSVNSIMSDPVGNLWIGGDHGLSLLNKNSKHYKSFSFENITLYKNEAPRNIEQNGNQLLVGVSKEVIVFDLQTEKFIKEKPNISPSGFHRFIKSGNNFYQPSQSSLTVYDLNFKLLKTIEEFHPNGSPMNIYNAMKDSEGNLWIVTSRFGLRKHEANGTILSFLNDSTQGIHSVGDIFGGITESRNGNIYAGGKQLFILQKGADDFTSVSILNEKISNEIRALKMKDSILWIGSRNGLFSFNENNETITFHNLPPEVNQVITALEIDRTGNIWMVTSSGIVKYNPGDSTTLVLNDKNGWPSSYSTIKALNDGRVAAGIIGEIILINPEEIQPENYSPMPSVTQVKIDEKVSYLMPEADTTFRIKYNQSIRFNYISLTYHNAANNKYAWQLKGLDDRWHNAGNVTSQPFASLAPGRYSFSIKSANASNVWSEKYSTIHFIVMPPFYRTGWFITLIAFIIGGIIYIFYRYRLQKAIQIERMRTRIATDLHDDIGATLSSISFYSEAVHQKTKNKLPEVSPILEKMGETSRSMVSSMSDIVWAINPQNDDMSKMLSRMKSYAHELSSLKEKPIHLEIDDKAQHLKLQLEQRRNIYLIFKEALNNALKYADCSQIWIHVKLKANHLSLKIEDDGKGFDTREEKEGNGIKNMQKRAADIGADINISSEKNKGTVIDLELLT
ncbi:MAG TPA: two-component regulator propeller domain-containing protein [Saprospiraceae bacterium]|nr:two-component regulator propeller domain-containing protein [Saprospiraceae bacterium]